MRRLKEIKEINGLSHFSDLQWDGTEAKKYNLVYGWNGTGKTTLSRIFRFFEKSVIDLDDFEDLRLSLETNDGTITENDIDKEEIKVRVFNEDFVEENLSFKESEANPIVIIGEGNIEIEKEINKLEKEIDKHIEDNEKVKSEISGIPDTSSILTDCGREVIEEFSNTQLAGEKYDGRRYDRRNVKNLIKKENIGKGNLESFKKEKEELRSLRETVSSKKEEIDKPNTDIGEIENIFLKGNRLLNKTIETESIERLERDEDIQSWVREGYDLHKERESSKCLFCSNEIPQQLLKRYGQFFTEEVSRSEEELENVISEVEELEQSIRKRLPDSSSFFSDLADSYARERNKAEDAFEDIQKACTQLKTRLDRRTGRMQIDDSVQEKVSIPSDSITQASESLEAIVDLCQRHNDRVRSTDEEAIEAARQIEVHTVASYLSQKDFFKHQEKTKRLKEEIEANESKIEEKEDIINEKRAELRNTAIAVEEINQIIAEFLGEGEIEMGIQSKEKEERYYVKRNGQRTKYLSDGEKSIVALAYFLVSLKKEGCDVEERIIIVDDPVDSQDTMFLFQAFGLLKRRLKDAGQLFILTHNYEFFNLVRDWLTSDNYRDESSLFRLEMKKDDGERVARLSNVPNLLKNHKTEYQYLFYKLYRYNEGEISIDEPLLPNIARKVLEHFSSFKWSCKTFESLGSIVQNRFIKSRNKRKSGVGDAVLKFMHEYSHGGNFGRRVTDSVIQADKICQNVLEFIYWADESHYKSLENEIEGLS